jgi:putative heme-binding domain-containing protein
MQVTSLPSAGLILLIANVAAFAAQSPNDAPRPLREYRDFAMGHEGNADVGRDLFNNPQRAACFQCHSVDGTASKAGPDLSSVGDKYPRPDLITAVLEPSAAIAVGYGATIVETKSDEEFQGVIKEATADYLDLMGADGKHVRINTRDIQSRRESALSLMPEGLQAGMSRQEFTDVIEYLVSLKQPESAFSVNRGMPSVIPEIAKAAVLRPVLGSPLRYPEDFVHKPGDVRCGMVWFGQIPGDSNLFLAGHQSGKIWLVERNSTNTARPLFADLSGELFNKSGPNGLLGMALHPKFRETRKYYVKHQVFEQGKIATVVVERAASADFRTDSGQPSRRLWKVESTTQDHSGGCINFGPDGYLYIAMGDTGPQNDPQGHGQDMRTQLAKILRIDVDHTGKDLPYAIPSDNPFRGQTNVCPEIWASGFREPWRFSFDSLTGDLWVGDVGQDRIEEVSMVRRGENMGWNVFEGFEPFSNRYRKEGTKYVPPVFAYRRKFGNSVTGGYVYRGDKKSSFYGVYICADYTSQRIFGLKQRDRVLQVVRQIGSSPQGVASFGTDEKGEIYVVGYEGMIYHLDLSGSSFDEEQKNTQAAAGAN